MSKRTIIIFTSVVNLLLAAFFVFHNYNSADLFANIVDLILLMILSPVMTLKLFNIFSAYQNVLIRICVSLVVPGLTAFILGCLSVIVFILINSPLKLIFWQLIKTPIYGLMVVFSSVFIWLFIGILDFIILSLFFKKTAIRTRVL